MGVRISKASVRYRIDVTGSHRDSADTLERHFARELHDRVAQRLVALVLEINELRSRSSATEPLTDELERLEESARQILRATRELLVDLRGRTDLRLNFIEALKSELAAAAPPEIKIEASARWPEHINGWAAFNLMRIAQQAVANGTHHGRATEIGIFLDINAAGEAVLLVVDNGVGMNGAPVGLGIIGMQERTTILGGEFSLSSREAGGTAIEVRVPGYRLE